MIQPRDRNSKLLDFLGRRSVADFEKFVRVLAKYQAHLVQLFVSDGGETVSQCFSQLKKYIFQDSMMWTE